MVKKINRDGITIKSLLNQGFKQGQIAKMLNISKQKVHYQMKVEIKTEQNRKKKLDKKYIDKICELAKDKLTSEMSSKRIASIINSDLERDASAEFLQNSYEESKSIKMKCIFNIYVF